MPINRIIHDRIDNLPLVQIGLILVILPLFVACNPVSEASIPCPENVCPESTCPDPVSYEELWSSSGHADVRAEAFLHWNEDSPVEIPTDCAKCHSRPGFIDFLGLDGTMVGRVDNPSPVGTTVTCFVCHNEETMFMSQVVFPSGVRVSEVGDSVVCMQCHQGTESSMSVNEAIVGLDDDVVAETLDFINIHYYAAGATILGAEVKGAYEYEGQTYQGRYLRAGVLFSCVQCHDQHSLKIEPEFCSECHTGFEGDYKKIRVDTTDYDGDGDSDEGIAFEVQALQEKLYQAILIYAKEVIDRPIVYDLQTYPYYFVDLDGNGEVGDAEAVYDNRYNAWTPRLLTAAYNYQFVSKDPGAYAHNADYVIQILYDSIAEIGGDVSGLQRPE